MKAPSAEQPFVTDVVETAVGPVPRVSPRLVAADTLGAWRVRWGIGRDDYKVDPGLYALGEPDPDSPVLLTSNYKLTFDVVRSSVGTLSAWLLVLDTRGVNVWCAAGKGTFSTQELVERVRFSRLADLLSHHRLIVPQLGATGVAAHEVRRQARFGVVYGPVRAKDIPAFLEAGMRATPEMREPTFTLRERLALTPVEIVGMRKPVAWVALAALALGLASTRPLTPAALAGNALGAAAPFLLGALGGAVLTPALLPWLPPRAFAAKGAIVGALLGAAFALSPQTSAGRLAAVLIAAAVASYVAMNYTGSTPFTSQTGVEREMRRWIPVQAVAAAAGVVAVLAGAVLR